MRSGIAVADAGTRAIVDGNSVSYRHADARPRAEPAGAGIRVTDGASAVIRENVLVGLATAGADGPDGTPLLAAGIRLRDAAADARIGENRVRYAHVGMHIDAPAPRLDGNTIGDSRADGLVVLAAGGEVAGARVTRSGRHGIVLAAVSAGVAIRDGDFTGNGGTDCVDLSTGSGTAGTANTWTDSAADASSPAGLCTASLTNAPPVLAGGPFSVAEDAADGTAVGTMTGTDPDVGQALAYAIVGGNAAGAFAIDAASGAIDVADGSALDHETAASVQLTVRATDDGIPARHTDATVTVSVTDVNEPPTAIALSDDAIAEGRPIDTKVGTLSTTDPDAGDTHTYSLVSTDVCAGPDAAAFAIGTGGDADTLRSAAVFDHATRASYAVCIRTTDGGGLHVDAAFTIAVTDAPPSAPADTDAAADTVAEGVADGTGTGVTAAATDPGGTTVTYALTDDADGRFAIDAATGVVTVADGARVDHESSGTGYAITVEAEDATGSTADTTFTIAVTNVAPSTPTDADATADAVTEGAAAGTAVGVTADATDPGGGPAVTYTIASDGSGGGFTVHASTGVVTVDDPAKIDHETSGTGSYDLTIAAADGAGGSAEETFTISVTDAAPSQPTDTDATADAVAEGTPSGTAVGITIAATDPSGGGVTYALTDDAGGRFAIDAETGVVTVSAAGATAVDYESSAGSYTITARATGGALDGPTEDFTIAVTDVAPSQPVDDDPAVNAVAEGAANGTGTGLTAAAEDVNGGTVAYAITADTSLGGFAIDAATGVVTVADTTLLTASTFTVTVEASAGSLAGETQDFTIDLIPNAVPVAEDGTATTDEDTAETITLSGTDADGDALTFAIPATTDAGGTLASQGAVDCASVADTCTTTILYTPPADTAGADAFTFTVDDGVATSDPGTVSITIAGVDDGPTLTATGLDPAFTENGTPVDLYGTVSASAVEASQALDRLVLTIANVAGTAAETLSVDGTAVPLVDGTSRTTAVDVLSVGVTVTAGTATVTIGKTGGITPARMEALVDGLAYGNTSDDPGSTARVVTLTSLRDTGAATPPGTNEVTALAIASTVAVTAVDDAPVIAVPAAADVDEDTALAFTGTAGVTVTDPDVGTADLAVQLGVTNGTLTMTTLTGLVFATGDGTADAAMAFTGTTAEIAAALATLRFDPTPDYPGAAASGVAAFTIAVDDQGASGTGGPLTDSASLSITVDQVNDAPVGGSDVAQTIANVELFVDKVPGAGVPATTRTTVTGLGVLDNDSDPVEGSAISVAGLVGCLDVTAPYVCATTNGGTVTLASDGRYSYRPAAGSTTTDTFQYLLTDGTPADDVAVTVTITFVGERIWFVRNTAAAGGLGRSHDPFDTLAEAQAAATTAGDRVFVYAGNGTTAGQNAGFAFQATGQTLQGEAVALTTKTTVNGVLDATLVPAGTRPKIAGLSGNGVDLAPGATLTGLAIGSNVDAIDLTTTSAAGGTVTIADNLIDFAGGHGIDIDLKAGTSGTVAVSITATTWNLNGTHTATAIDIDRAAGTLTLALRNTLVVANGGGIDIAGGSAASTTITAFAGTTIHRNTGGAGVAIRDVTFDAVPGGGVQVVDGDTLAIGVSDDRVGGAGLAITGAAGSLFFDDLDVFSSGTALALAGTSPGLTFSVVPIETSGSSTLSATAGRALDATDATIDLRLAYLQSAGATAGVSLARVGGRFSAPAASAIDKTSGTGTAFSVSDSVTGSTIAYAGTLNVTAGAGVALARNTGATIAFSGALTLSTGTEAAFSAVGGGTVTVVDPAGVAANTITTTTGTALTVTATTIGAVGLTFQRISAGTSGTPQNGIVLTDTGGAGGLRITGDGGTVANASGGTIRNTTGAAIVLTRTAKVDLAYLQITDPGTDGIAIREIDGFRLHRSAITDTVGTSRHAAIEVGDFSTGTSVDGTISITDSAIGPESGSSPHDALAIGIGSGTSTWTITGTTFRRSGNGGISLELRGTAQVTAFTVTDSTFAGAGAATTAFGLFANTLGDAELTALTLERNMFSGNNIHVDLGQQNDTDPAGGHTFRVADNTLLDAGSHAIDVFSAAGAFGGTFTGTILGNTIGAAARAGSGSAIGNGIRVNINGGADATIRIADNTVRQTPNGRGIEVIGRNGTGGLDVTIEGNTVTPQDTSGSPLAAILVQSNCLTVCNTVRADVRGNTVPAGQDVTDLVDTYIGVVGSATTTVELVDAPGSAGATCAAELAATNTGSASASGECTLIAGPIGVP